MTQSFKMNKKMRGWMFRSQNLSVNDGNQHWFLRNSAAVDSLQAYLWVNGVMSRVICIIVCNECYALICRLNVKLFELAHRADGAEGNNCFAKGYPLHYRVNVNCL